VSHSSKQKKAGHPGMPCHKELVGRRQQNNLNILLKKREYSVFEFSIYSNFYSFIGALPPAL
jgi:hypothetical protein